ncbi:MAG: ribulose-phosphate 3-epimerase [Nitrospirae bacterium]|nr:ribulose-phosphate 3-epimerase [Nitrospirota bacterium]
MKIVPAILTESGDECVNLMRLAQSFADFIQIDIMDGLFVSTRSFPPETLNGMPTSIFFELHLMVKDPMSVVQSLNNRHIKKIIFHAETLNNYQPIIVQIRSMGISPGIAVKPETELNRFIRSAPLLDTIFFLTVDPGNYGSPFRPEVLNKISRARKLFPAAEIGVDGAVSLDNIRSFVDIGVDYACVGSRIFRSESPKASYLQFIRKLKEIEVQNEF